MSDLTISKQYLQTLKEIKDKIKSSQIRAHLSVNKEMLMLYWQIGKIIIEQREVQNWGNKIIDKLACDLRSEFETMKGFSSTNLKYMALFAQNYPDLLRFEDKKEIGQQSADQLGGQYFVSDKWVQLLNIPWFHNVEIMTKLKENNERFWYVNETIKNGWSRNVLMHQIKSNLYKRQVKSGKTNNFEATLPDIKSDLAQNLIKDEYNFDFLRGGDFKEKDLEDALVDNITKFLLELGNGFAFVGKQYHLEVGGDDFYIDLLFYNIKLKSYFVIELKTGKFKPEYTGKMLFYLAAIDDSLKEDSDNDSIGIILCTDKNQEVADKSIRYITKPVGVSKYEISNDIKGKIEEVLPSEQELRAKLKKMTKAS